MKENVKERVLYVENLQKYYGGRGNLTKAIDNITFEVEEGEFLAIMGASGSGKTTLLNCISTVDQATAGKIYVEDQEITKLSKHRLTAFRRDKLGFIFQEYNLLDTLTAYENIALALTIHKVGAKEIDQRVREYAKLLGIEDVLDKFPYEMSGGQRQRVAAARAMITQPSLVLADEPTGALDSKSARNLLEQFVSLNASKNATLLMVTHDAFSASFCKRVLFLKDGKIWNEIHKGAATRKDFFEEIIQVMGVLGGEMDA